MPWLFIVRYAWARWAYPWLPTTTNVILVKSDPNISCSILYSPSTSHPIFKDLDSSSGHGQQTDACGNSSVDSYHRPFTFTLGGHPQFPCFFLPFKMSSCFRATKSGVSIFECVLMIVIDSTTNCIYIHGHCALQKMAKGARRDMDG